MLFDSVPFFDKSNQVITIDHYQYNIEYGCTDGWYKTAIHHKDYRPHNIGNAHKHSTFDIGRPK